jgi:DNA-binding transcriptional MerR regulator
MKDRFTTFEIRDSLGITVDRLKDWQKRGFITPSVRIASGAGTKNIFNRLDVYCLELFRYLLGRGFSREMAADRIKTLKDVKSIMQRAKEHSKELGEEWSNRVAKTYLSLLTSEYLIFLGETRDNFRGPKVLFVRNSLEDLCISKHILVESDTLIIVNFLKIRNIVDAALGE